MNRLLLEGKSVLVTGGGSGIGLAICELFVQEGASVAMMGRRKAVLEAECGRINARGYPGRAAALPGDVGKVEDIKRVLAETIEAFGKLDVLVNSAGLDGKQLSIEATDDAFYDELMQCNQRGTFMCCREAIRYFLPRNEGNIINVASVNSIRPVAGAAYGAAKFAILGITKNVGMRLVGTGIRINALCPGTTITPMADSLKDDKGLFGYDADHASAKCSGELDVPDGKMTEIMRARTNRGVPCQPYEVANAALFMASDLSSGMQGQSLVIDKGGYL